MQRALMEFANAAKVGGIGSEVVDGNYLTEALRHDSDQLGATIFAMVRGDAKVAAISAASIIAKVTRDRIMKHLERKYLGYGFAVHSGYGSASHLLILKEKGLSSSHRTSFAPLAASLRTQEAPC